jgi:hypothetical protein
MLKHQKHLSDKLYVRHRAKITDENRLVSGMVIDNRTKKSMAIKSTCDTLNVKL